MKEWREKFQCPDCGWTFYADTWERMAECYACNASVDLDAQRERYRQLAQDIDHHP